jgi:hypothetical protein
MGIYGAGHMGLAITLGLMPKGHGRMFGPNRTLQGLR